MLTGGCLCGAVRFAVSSPPLDAGYCHCRRCQGRTGTGASVGVIIAPGSFELLRGAAQLGSWKPEGGSEKFFCRECGAHVFAQRPDAPQPGVIRMSAFDTDPGIRPSYRAWVASAATWESIPEDGLPRYPGPRPR